MRKKIVLLFLLLITTISFSQKIKSFSSSERIKGRGKIGKFEIDFDLLITEKADYKKGCIIKFYELLSGTYSYWY